MQWALETLSQAGLAGAAAHCFAREASILAPRAASAAGSLGQRVPSSMRPVHLMVFAGGAGSCDPGGGGGRQTPPEQPAWGSHDRPVLPPQGLGLGLGLGFGFGCAKIPQSPRHPEGPTGPSPAPLAPSPLSGGAADAGVA